MGLFPLISAVPPQSNTRLGPFHLTGSNPWLLSRLPLLAAEGMGPVLSADWFWPWGSKGFTPWLLFGYFLAIQKVASANWHFERNINRMKRDVSKISIPAQQ